MIDREVLKDWQCWQLNETLYEHVMRMEGSMPWNVLSALHRENEREDSAMLPTSRSSSNGGCGNAAKATRRAEAQLRRLGEQGSYNSPRQPPPQGCVDFSGVDVFAART
jgi:hypothetical protein